VTKNHGAAFRIAVLAICIALGACKSQKEPAQTLIDEIELTLAGTAADAAKYAPTQFHEVDAELGTLRRSYDAKDYADVLSRGPAVLAAAGELIGTASAAKADRTRALNLAWSALAESLPNRMSALATRVDRLAARPRGKAADGVDVAAAKAALRDIYALWSKARSAFASRNIEEAVQTADAVKAKIDELSEVLGPSDG
jgi:hypothetical protein